MLVAGGKHCGNFEPRCPRQAIGQFICQGFWLLPAACFRSCPAWSGAATSWWATALSGWPHLAVTDADNLSKAVSLTTGAHHHRIDFCDLWCPFRVIWNVYLCTFWVRLPTSTYANFGSRENLFFVVFYM